jgi:DNA-binding MurR/RpiR family transcriptional regulator
MSVPPPTALDPLRQQIAAEYHGLSPRLREIAQFALEHPTDMAVEKIAVLAERIGVPPSALVRFAKAFGYEGFSDIQRVFRENLLNQSVDYSERIRSQSSGTSRASEQTSDAQGVLRAFVDAEVRSLRRLARDLPGDAIDRAAAVLAEQTGTIYVAGYRRAFPVASYLSYALRQLDLRVALVDGLGGTAEQQLRAIRSDDVMVVISFRPYGPAAVEAAAAARKVGAPVLALTDSELSPVADRAAVQMLARDAEVSGFRSLNASLCIAQTLVVVLAHRLLSGGD